MKILAFAASNSSNSINKKLATYATTYFKGETIEILDLNDYEMPIFNPDRLNQNGMHSLAIDFAKKIDQSDLLIISLAEYNGSYSTAFKNIFDYISRLPNRKAFGEKPVLLLATSPGGRGGITVLEMAKNNLPFSGGNVLATFSLPKFYENFDNSKGIINERLRSELENKINLVKGQILRELLQIHPN
jgi:chromate reductase, NAD(P)H dehydrogenase (quinone)